VAFSRFISASFQLFARGRIHNRDREKQQRKKNHQQIHVRSLDKSNSVLPMAA
jgi:hypothetical protein